MALDKPASWREAFAVYLHPRVLAMLFLGFSAGLPFLMVFSTLTAWLRMSDARKVSFGQSLRTGSRLMAYSVPLMIAMWVFFPRIATPFWSVPIDTSSASSGLSDRMSPGDISSLSLSNAVAFRVDFEDDDDYEDDVFAKRTRTRRRHDRAAAAT